MAPGGPPLGVPFLGAVAGEPVATPTKMTKSRPKSPNTSCCATSTSTFEPEKQYAYRVFLLLYNPNHGMDANVLEEAELAGPLLGLKRTRKSRDENGKLIWIDTDPHYAAGRSPARRTPCRATCGCWADRSSSPKLPKRSTLEVRILRWLKKSGLNATFAKSGLIRGTVLNFDKAQMKMPGGGKTTRDLSTNCILVDIMGGEVLQPPKGE